MKNGRKGGAIKRGEGGGEKETGIGRIFGRKREVARLENGNGERGPVGILPFPLTEAGTGDGVGGEGKQRSRRGRALLGGGKEERWRKRGRTAGVRRQPAAEGIVEAAANGESLSHPPIRRGRGRKDGRRSCLFRI